MASDVIKKPNRMQVIKMALAIRDAYFEFDQEDWCEQEEGMACRKCKGCIHYTNLFTIYKIAEKFLPKEFK